MAKAKQTQEQKINARLDYLRDMITKYAHRWGENPSDRMVAWIDEYNDIKENNREIFNAHCKQRGACPTHDAYDLLA